MAFSIDYIHSALHDLELLEKSSNVHKHTFTELIHRLRNVRTFLLCAKKLVKDVHMRSDDNGRKEGNLGSLLIRRLKNLRTFVQWPRKLGSELGSGGNSSKDGNLESLPVKIEDEVCRFARKIHPYCLSLEHGFPSNVVDMTGDFQDEIESFDKEIDEWYDTFWEYLLQSKSPRTDEVLEITDSVLENLGDIVCFHTKEKRFLLELVKDLRENIKFLRNFIRFAMMQRFEHPRLKPLRNFIGFVTMQRVEHPRLEPLLTHIEAVAVNAAHISHMCQYDTIHKVRWERLPSVISELLLKIKPIDPQVYKTYTRVLPNSYLTRKLHAPAQEMDDNRILTMREFIDSLACILWEMLQLDTCLVVPLKDKLQVLYEGLRFLRIILKEQPNKFDQKNMNLTEVVICGAGMIIFSLSHKDVETDIALSDLLRRIKLIREEVEEKGPEALTFNFPKTNELGFVDSLLENLVNFTINNVDSNVHSYVQTIQEQLVFLVSFLKEIEELRSGREELQSLWDRAVLVAYRVEFLIDHLVFGGILDSFKMSFDCITEEIIILKKGIDDKRQDMKVKQVSRRSSRVPSQKSAVITNEVVGFVDEAASIVNRLTRGSKQLRIVAIVGMAGLGKTTLATKVYNDPLVLCHFDVCAWCSVSQVFNRKKVLLELLNHIVPHRYFDMTEQDLAEKLRHLLKGRRYLIFLDDIWGIGVWNSLEESLPDDSNGSRIILTSRLQGVVPRYKLDEKPHFLRHLTNYESWELLQRKLFNGEGWPQALYGLGMKISENCKGLPLTIIIVAGLLSTTEQEFWEELLKTLSSGIILSSIEQCMNTMELSYKNLPDYLKPCFLYFGTFPEDQEVSVKRLIQFWIAEGFVRKTKLKSLEDVAKDYLMDLIGRSLVMVGKERSIGGVKTCRIHDLLHDFCLMKAENENFFRLLRGYDELLAFNEPCYLRRLCIHSEPEHFKDSRLFCPRVRTLLFFSQAKKKQYIPFNISFVIHIFKLLRVLDLEQIHLGSVFPTEMELLVQLKYLAVQGEMEVIPSSFGNLSNLETFVVKSRSRYVSLPDTLWNLWKLRHLNTSGLTWFVLPMKNLDNSSDFCELSSLSGALVSWAIMDEQLRKMPNIRKLKCKLLGDLTGNCNKIMFSDVLSQLESLEMSLYWSDAKKVGNHIELGFPVNLRKLTLSLFMMPWSKISKIGTLPNLEVLNLLDRSFSGGSWDMEEGEFPKLRILKLSQLDLERWRASDEHFPCLQKLVLDRCWHLQEMPSSLDYISTLDVIEVSDCTDCTINLVKDIQEKQMSMGNSILKLLIRF